MRGRACRAANLPVRPQHMHLALIRDKAKVFPRIDNPSSYQSARIWHCSYRTLQPVALFTKLRTLVIATYPDSSFDIIAGLVWLQALEVLHLPRITDLSPLAQLKNLRRLSLRTVPSWDGSGKATVVDSLAPIAGLPLLEDLELIGVVPKIKKADDLLSSSSLKRCRVSKFPRAEQQRLHARFAA